MAALNYSIYLEDQGDNGLGPYTVSLRENPSTPPAGGTEKLSDTNALGTKNFGELAYLASQFAHSLIANANDVDDNN